jgi:hypothetical protein
MAKSTKAKWVIGLTGTALSAFVISQIGTNQQGDGNAAAQAKPVITETMSAEEKKLVQFDWSNYQINGATVAATVTGGVVQSDRQTRRS